MRPFPAGPPNHPVTQHRAPCSPSPSCLREESWHLREGEVCGQIWDFSVTIHRPSPGVLTAQAAGKRSLEGG